MTDSMSRQVTVSELRVPRELEIVLNGPVGPQRLRDDTIVIEEDGWYRTLTPSARQYSAANEILFCNLDQRHTHQHIDRIIAEYHGQGLAFSWCVYPWTQPESLGELLLARGATCTKVRAYLGSTSIPLNVVEGVDITQVNPAPAAEEIEAYVSTLSHGYELPVDEEAFRLSRYRQLCSGSDPAMRLLIARCDGVVAGCSGIVIKKGSAHLTSASVLPQYQARGVFQSLIATSLSLLRDMGIALASGHSNDKSAFWVERFGFKFIYPYEIYELEPTPRVG